MKRPIRRWGWGLPAALLIVFPLGATSVPSLTFEELTDHSEMIVAGQITRSWADWDSERKFIWTHYELSVSSVQKGKPAGSVVLSEPGGVVGIQGMTIAGAVTYQPGGKVLVFLQRMPNGYLRTTGWSQGKYNVDQAGRIHAEASLRGLEVVSVQKGSAPGQLTAAGTSLRSIDGITIGELEARIAARLKMQGRTN
jgi:hypothetical protein